MEVREREQRPLELTEFSRNTLVLNVFTLLLPVSSTPNRSLNLDTTPSPKYSVLPSLIHSSNTSTLSGHLRGRTGIGTAVRVN
jgi:hypothetical protein